MGHELFVRRVFLECMSDLLTGYHRFLKKPRTATVQEQAAKQRAGTGAGVGAEAGTGAGEVSGEAGGACVITALPPSSKPKDTCELVQLLEASSVPVGGINTEVTCCGVIRVGAKREIRGGRRGRKVGGRKVGGRKVGAITFLLIIVLETCRKAGGAGIWLAPMQCSRSPGGGAGRNKGGRQESLPAPQTHAM